MPRRRKTSRHKKPLSLVTLAIIALLSLPLIWFSFVSRPINPNSNKRVNFTIQKGESLDSIARTLQDEGLIRSVPAFKIQVMISNLSTKIQAGDFAVPPNLNLSQVANSLTLGTSDRWVTIPEGWRREEIAQALVDALSQDNPDYTFDADKFVVLTENLEGKLYPDTYSFSRETTTEDAVDRLITQFNTQTADLKNNSSLTDYQALILASLIEREALFDPERPTIAGVLLNRLDNNWPLQVDATIQYVKASNNCTLLTCDWWANDITKADLELNSPYNTYTQPGLPPSPISNPSAASLKAAYNPSQTPYWFYLHDPSGEVHFAKTIEEHNSNITKYLK